MKLMWLLALLIGFSPICMSAEQAKPDSKLKKMAARQTKDNAAQKITTSGFSYLVEQIPAWVSPVNVVSNPTEASQASISILLNDEQIKLDKVKKVHFTHMLKQINASAGLSVASQIQVEFDPSYQELVLHKLEIVRDAKRLDKFDARRIQLLQREKQLEARLYDGRVTASIVLEDVRVGDQIEYSYSVRGSNPVFDSKFILMDHAGSALGSTSLYQLRLIYGEDRQIYSRIPKAMSVQTLKTDVGNELILTQKSIPQDSFEDGAAVSSFLPQLVQLSEFPDWGEVAKWGEQLFRIAYQSDEKLTAYADAWRQLPTDDAKLLAALDFVQKDIRYFGTEIGVNSHKPNVPTQIIQQRYGDCKDKSTLLIGLLHALNIRSKPVLVSTLFRDETSNMLPSPLAFNHVIVQVELDGKHLWLDPTRDQQTGSPMAREVRDYGKVLIAESLATQLLPIPSSMKELHRLVEDKFSLISMKEDPVLISTTTYYGADAESMREYLARTPKTEVQANYAKSYLRPYPKLRFMGDLKMNEKIGENAIELIQSFELREFWNFHERDVLKSELAFWSLEEQLNPPKDVIRKSAYHIPSPGVYRHKIVAEFSEDLIDLYKEEKFSEGQANFILTGSLSTTPKISTWVSELRFLTQTVTPTQWRSFADKIKQVRPHFYGRLMAHALTKAQLTALEKDMESIEKSSSGIRIYIHDASKAIILYANAMIGSERLSPELKKLALMVRAKSTLNLKLYDHSVQDINAALELSAEPDLDVMRLASLIAVAKGQDAAATDLIKQIFEIAPHDKTASELEVVYAYLRKDFSMVKTLSEVQLATREASTSYLALLQYLASRELGGRDDQILQTQLDGGESDEDVTALLEFYQGKKSVSQLVNRFGFNKVNLIGLCQLYFFAGEKMRLDGDLKLAKEYWGKAVAAGMAHRFEYMAAERRLKEYAAN